MGTGIVSFEVSSNSKENLALAEYMRESEEWAITSYDISGENGTLLLALENTPTNWTVTKITLTNSTGILVQLKLSRKSSYFVYNLIVPLLVIVSLGVSAIAVPSDTHQKPELLLAILLAFTLYQLLLADNTPKTSTAPRPLHHVLPHSQRTRYLCRVLRHPLAPLRP